VRVLRLYASLGVLAAALYPVAMRSGWGYDAWYLLFGVAATAAMAAGALRRGLTDRLPWALIAVGLLLFTLGDGVYLVYSVRDAEMPFPSAADALYLAGYPFLGAGLLRLIRVRAPGRDWPTLVDAAIITTAVSGAVWAFVMGPIVGDRELTGLQKMVSLAQPMADVALMAFATRMFISSTRASRAFQLLTGAVLVQLAGDLGYGIGTLQGWYDGEGLMDLTWVASYVLWGASALHPDMVELSEQRDELEEGLGRRRLALLVAAILAAPAMMVYGSVRAASAELVVTAATSVVVFLLVVVRLAGLVSRQERARRREQSLRSSAATLVTARTREDVLRVLRDTVTDLVGPLATTEILPGGEALGERADDLVDAVVLGEGPASDDLEARVTPPPPRPGTARVLIAPVLERGRPEGVLLVRAAEPLPLGAIRAVETLVSQACLALDAVHRAADLLERRSRERFRSLVHRSRDVIAILEEDGTIRFVTPSVGEVLGFHPDAIVGRRLQELVPVVAVPGDLSLVEAVARAGGRMEREAVLRHRDGTWRTFDAVVTDMRDDPSVAGLVVTAHDITDRKALEEQLTHQAFHDSLTGLPNRALFADRVTHALTRSRGDETIGVLFIDIDDFKTINDSLGHAAGDALLVEVAQRLRASLRPSDTPARLGGDEFAILVEDVDDPSGLVTVAERVLEALREPFDVGGAASHARASVGIAVGRPGQSAGDLLRNADLAMYRAKAAGGFRHALFEDEMHRAASKRLQLKADLSRAVEHGALDAAFQPIVHLDTTRVAGAEALLRWTHPTAGPIEPAVFVPLAEETGLILELGRWILARAVREARDWEPLPDGRRPFVSVNISAKQLQDPAFVPLVADVLAASRFDPARLVLEITESTLMVSPETVVGRLEALRDVGVRVWIDDFGTGFSSLSYLQHLPVSALKIPKPFVDALSSQGDGAQLADAVVQVAESLRLETIAEGIETSQQRVVLLSMGCQYGQGFLFAHPVAAPALPQHGIYRIDPPAVAA
jgi:diguanylate cyclase (GGDEF)-like protein/PAS domain S-box-containing protein